MPQYMISIGIMTKYIGIMQINGQISLIGAVVVYLLTKSYTLALIHSTINYIRTEMLSNKKNV